MDAHAAIGCELVAGSNRLTRLRSQGQLVLRPTYPKGFEPWADGSRSVARASLSAGAAGPLGGDRLFLDIHVGPDATLVLNEVSATLALPGVRGGRSVMTYRVHVEAGGTLIWLPEPVIAAHHCDHRQLIHVELAPTARFHLREQLILGRHGEPPGDLGQHLRIVRGAEVLHDQELRLGSNQQGWDSPAVLERAQAVGTLVVVDPGSGIGRGRSDLVNDSTISVGIDDDVVQATALAPDSLLLSHSLDSALRCIGAPWAPPPRAASPEPDQS